MPHYKATFIHTKAATRSLCCVLPQSEDVTEELSEEESRIVWRAQRTALEVLEDTLRKDRVLIKNLKDVVVLDRGSKGDGCWVERYAMLTEKLLRQLISQLEQAPRELEKDSQPGTLIHEASHFLGLHDITYTTASFQVGTGGAIIWTDSHTPAFESLRKALLNANSIEYEFEIVLKHREPYRGDRYACCGETARNSICENAVPWSGLSCGPTESSAVRRSTIGDTVRLSLLPARDAMKKCLSDIWKVVEAVDKCHRGAMVANVTGGAVGMAGGVAALAGLLLAPTMLGTSLVLSAVGFGISTVGGLTSATATISDSVNSLVKKGEVETLVEEFQRQVEIFTGSLEPFKTARGLLEFLGQDESTEVILGVFRVVGGLGRSVLNVTSMAKASTVLAGTSHAVRFAGTATHILVGLSLALDLFFVTKDSVHFHHGARSELAKSIRAAAATLEREFNIIDEFCEKINRILEEQE
ncbi:uncharacterized protein LOC112972053 isoform X1 [Apteryx rowi]|uniref:uncharacterized protein LOC112972053 isoform X1 n=2 Tax=Apteryx rowi TaxID=308060 RepID=UPI000E1DD3F8|nr:uncharacterized protein LOC112972053 isoform X1 [Apteryx rowi]XP_025933893.1 uncharacterized protein LOC112972053 isoform X1 [Apteryx rowi]